MQKHCTALTNDCVAPFQISKKENCNDMSCDRHSSFYFWRRYKFSSPYRLQTTFIHFKININTYLIFTAYFSETRFIYIYIDKICPPHIKQRIYINFETCFFTFFSSYSRMVFLKKSKWPTEIKFWEKLENF